MEQIEIIKPDDWHVHFRDNEILEAVVPETTRHFARSIVMPNLIPPILNAKQAIEYKKRIEKAIPSTDSFEPLMTIYLTEETNKTELKQAYKDGAVFAVKLYPAGATTNSDSGVKDIKKIMPVLEMMAEIGMPLLIHGEITDKEIDIFDREKVFINTKLDFICREIPNLKIICGLTLILCWCFILKIQNCCEKRNVVVHLLITNIMIFLCVGMNVLS